MKKYLITVKGVSYEVEVEEIKGRQEGKPAPAPFQQTVAAPVAKEAPAPVAPKAAPASPKAGGSQITSPMPGSIFKVMVKAGDSVKKGDVVIVLEAMKMENEIFAVADGVVASVEISEGATVNTGDVLVTFE